MSQRAIGNLSRHADEVWMTAGQQANGVWSSLTASTFFAVGGLTGKLQHPNPDVRRVALEALTHLPSLEQHVPDVAYLLMDDDRGVRRAAVHCLGRLPSADASSSLDRSGTDERPAYLQLLPACQLLSVQPQEELERHRLHAAAFEPSVVSAMTLLADAQQVASVRLAATQSIGRVPSHVLPHHGELLASLLEDEASQVRKAGLEAMGRMPHAALARYVPELLARLDDSAHHVRLVAVKTVGVLVRADDRLFLSSECAASLISRLADADKYVRSAAKQALCRLDPALLDRRSGSLIAILLHSSTEVRLGALEVLERCASQQPALMRIVMRLARLDENALVRSQATRTLERKDAGAATHLALSSPLQHFQPAPARPQLCDLPHNSAEQQQHEEEADERDLNA